MFSGVYGIFNHNGKIYIGSAVDVYSRFNTHKSLLNRCKHTSVHLQRAWNRDGQRNFDFKVIEVVSNKADLIKREQYWLNKFKSYNGKNGYNICKVAGSTLGRKASNKTKKLFSKMRKGKKFTKEHKRKISKALLNYERTEIHNKNIGKALTGLLVGNKNPFFGKKHTEKFKMLRRQQELGKRWSQKRKESRRGSGNPFFGKKHTKKAWEKTRVGFRCYVLTQRLKKEPAKKGGNSHV